MVPDVNGEGNDCSLCLLKKNKGCQRKLVWGRLKASKQRQFFRDLCVALLTKTALDARSLGGFSLRQKLLRSTLWGFLRHNNHVQMRKLEVGEYMRETSLHVWLILIFLSRISLLAFLSQDPEASLVRAGAGCQARMEAEAQDHLCLWVDCECLWWTLHGGQVLILLLQTWTVLWLCYHLEKENFPSDKLIVTATGQNSSPNLLWLLTALAFRSAFYYSRTFSQIRDLKGRQQRITLYQKYTFWLRWINMKQQRNQ